MHVLNFLARAAQQRQRRQAATRGGQAASLFFCALECLTRCTERLLAYFNKWYVWKNVAGCPFHSCSNVFFYFHELIFVSQGLCLRWIIRLRLHYSRTEGHSTVPGTRLAQYHPRRFNCPVFAILDPRRGLPYGSPRGMDGYTPSSMDGAMGNKFGYEWQWRPAL